jgi:hypothetical protein
MKPFAHLREQLRKSRLETQINNLVDMPPEVLIARFEQGIEEEFTT